MNWQANDLYGEWKRFKQHCQFTFGGPLSNKTEKEKVNYLMTYIGDKGREIYLTFQWGTAERPDGTEVSERDTLSGVYQKYETYVQPKKNEIRATVNFHRRKQLEGEKFDNFVTDLKLLVKDCHYREEERMVRDAIVLRSSSQAVKEKCLEKGDELTLDMAISIGQNYESAQDSMQAINSEKDTVHAIQTRMPPRHKNFYNRDKGNKDNQQTNSPPKGKRCARCGYTKHTSGQCPAIGQTCSYCKKPNHFLAVCRRKKQPAHMMDEIEDESSEDEYLEEQPEENLAYSKLFAVADATESANADKADWYVNIQIGEQKVGTTAHIDTGSARSIMPMHIYKNLKQKPELVRASRRFVTYSNHKLDLHGRVTMNTMYKDRSIEVEYYVVGAESKPILLSGADSERLHLIQRISSIDGYPELDETTGTLPGVCTLKIDPTHKPVVHPPRRPPHALAAKIADKLDDMERNGHIKKVDEPTDWVNSMVTVVKNEKIRICIDPKDLNKAIRREHYPIPTVEEVLASMPDAKVFSVLDAKSGFLQIRLDYESSLLTTFNTPKGRYRWLRLPFGIKSAPEIFQKVMDGMLDGISGANAIMDDILIAGSNEKEHDAVLHKVLNKAKEYDLKLNMQKCQVRKSEVRYVGHLVTADGLKPDPDKIAAVKRMAAPTTKREVQQFLGFVQYLAKFIPGLSEIDKPLRELTLRDTLFMWGKPQQQAFDELKRQVTEAPVLAFYDVNKDVMIQCDASSYALGGVLLQDGHPVAYTSRAMTETESRYAQIEKEMLAIVHSCRKFHHYIFGKATKVESDHKPLQAIFKKPLLSAPMRLQSMLLRLQPYDLEVTYKPGKEIPIGDALSRANLPEAVPDMEPLSVNMMEHIPVTAERYAQFQTCTAGELNELHAMIMKGWPDTKQQVPHSIRDYWNVRDQLSVLDGIIYKGMRIVVPVSMRRELLNKIHESHQGSVKSKQRAREALFWPRMTQQIEEVVESCAECSTFQKAQHAEEMLPAKHPDLPWSEVASDLFEFEGSSYLLTIDYYSKFIEVDELTSITSGSVIKALKAQFCRHGIPEKLRTDNGPQYVSAEFAAFCAELQIEHETSSPRYPQSNGEAERAVQTVKGLWKKCKDKQLALLDYRTTPLASCNLSPAQLLMGRRPRNKLPTSRKLLEPRSYNRADVKERFDKEKARQTFYYNKKAGQNLPVLEPGDPVRMTPLPGSKQWLPGTVIQHHRTPRSYVIDHNGRRYRRNRRHLRLATHEANRRCNTTAGTGVNPPWFNHHPVADSRPSQNRRPADTPPRPSAGVSTPTPQRPPSQPNTAERPPPAGRSSAGDSRPSGSTYVTRSGRASRKPDRLDL